MKNRINSNLILLSLSFFIYLVLTLICWNNGYFWDNIQQTSKEAHWFYLNHFSKFLMPAFDSGAYIVATGYHPPLMGIMTAFLWIVFGYKLWVSHVFVLVWGLILLYNLWKIIASFFPQIYVGWVSIIVVVESTLLTQFAVASPDYIMFVAFVMALRAIFEKKSILLSVAFFFLCAINMRGIFVGAILLFVHGYYIYLQAYRKHETGIYLRKFLPYLPTLVLLSAYFTYYFLERGWFFSNSSSYAGHYSQPHSFIQIIRHFASFGLRSVENGRIVIWLIAIYVTFVVLKRKLTLSSEIKVLILCFLLLNALYFVFVFITQMPFTERYFMPQFFLLTILACRGVIEILNFKKSILLFSIILCFEITGHFWIYPEKIVTFWDCTLAHLPYYQLRDKCFDYIDEKKIDYNDVAGSFCFYDDRRFVELRNEGKIVGDTDSLKYYIYSNISNAKDEWLDELKTSTRLIPVKRFEKGLVHITIYKNVMSQKK